MNKKKPFGHEAWWVAPNSNIDFSARPILKKKEKKFMMKRKNYDGVSNLAIMVLRVSRWAFVERVH